MLTATLTVRCDRCGFHDAFATATKWPVESFDDRARRLADGQVASGWLDRGRVWFCPRCVESARKRFGDGCEPVAIRGAAFRDCLDF